MPPPITATLSGAPLIATSRLLLCPRQPVKKRLSRGGSAYFGAADEVDKAAAGVLRRPLTQALGPGLERIGRIAVGLSLGAAPEVHINKIRGDLEVGAAVVDDEPYPVMAEQLGDGGGRTAR